MESNTTRREFLRTAAKTTAGLGGALSGITFLAHPERVFGANGRVRVAVCGLHGRGKDHLSAFSHLSVHMANASYRLGRTLHFDPETERVIGDDEANNLLRDGDRGYRAPFTVPEEV